MVTTNLRLLGLVLIGILGACEAQIVSAGQDGGPADAEPPVALEADAGPPDASPGPDAGPAPYGVQRPVAIDDTTSFGEAPPFGYQEYLPGRYADDPDKRWPLIIALHGIGECGTGSLTDLAKEVRPGVGLAAIIQAGNFAAHDQFIVLSPQDGNTSQYMNPTKVASFLAWAKAHYRVDTHRMYLTGLSFGGRSAWDYVNVNGAAGEFAAVVTVPGDGSYDTFDCAKAGQTPHWAFQGGQDDNFFTSLRHVQASIDGINGCATPPVERARLTIYPDLAHVVWNATYSLSGMQRTVQGDPYDVDIYTWFLQHTR